MITGMPHFVNIPKNQIFFNVTQFLILFDEKKDDPKPGPKKTNNFLVML